MNFVIDYEVCAGLLAALLTIYFLIEKKLPIIENRIFRDVLIFLLLSIVTNIISVFMLNTKDRFSFASLYFINILYYVAQSLLLAFFYGYIILITHHNETMSRWLIYVLILPLIFFTIFAMFTPLTKMLFYLDAEKNFLHGNYIFVSYLVSLFYMALFFVLIVINRKKIDTNTTNAFKIFFLVSIIAQIIQFEHQEYLIISIANVLGIIIFFLTVQSPRNHIDSQTKLFNAVALQTYLDYAKRRKKEYLIVAFSVESFDHINSIFGIDKSNKISIQMANYLLENYKKGLIFRCNGNRFIVLLRKENPGDFKMRKTGNSFINNRWKINELNITLSINAFEITSPSVKKISSFFSIMEFLFNRLRVRSLGLYKKVDEEDIDSFINYNIKNDSLILAIENNTIEVHYQPIYSISENRIVSIEALARIKNKNEEYISPDVFIGIAEKNGQIAKLSEMVLENVCQFLKKVDIRACNIDRISINLSVIQFMQTDFVDNLINILSRNNISHDLIGLEIIESVATSSVINIQETMKKLIDLGFCFYLDDYGKGYSNIEYITNLPFEFIKIDKSIILSYETNETMRLFLEGIISILQKTKRKIIVEGVEKKEHVEILKNLDIDFVQGFYYSRPLPEQRIIDLVGGKKK